MIKNSPSSTDLTIYSNSVLFEQEILQSIIPDLPDFDLTHIHRLTNETGIIQHAKYSIPNYHFGYCLDDNSRALMLATAARKIQRPFRTKRLISTYLSYIYYMQLENGMFRNFLSFDHKFLDDEGTEDSYGRTVWSLGFFAKYNIHSEFTYLAQEIFQKSLPHCQKLRSVRAIAYTLLGLMDYYETYPEEKELLADIIFLVNFIKDEYYQASNDTWQWYEEIMTYDNAILPLSILRASQLLHCKELEDIGIKTSLFLDKIMFQEEYLTTIGNASWYIKDGNRSLFGQQPIEIPSLLSMYKRLYAITENPKYKHRMQQTFSWFFGKNSLQLKLYDPVTKGCCDGLDSHGINLNQGAESTISFWMSYLYMFSTTD